MWVHIFEFCTLTKASVTNKETFLTMKGQGQKTVVLMMGEKKDTHAIGMSMVKTITH
jgi:hypothetical protein